MPLSVLKKKKSIDIMILSSSHHHIDSHIHCLSTSDV